MNTKRNIDFLTQAMEDIESDSFNMDKLINLALRMKSMTVTNITDDEFDKIKEIVFTLAYDKFGGKSV